MWPWKGPAWSTESLDHVHDMNRPSTRSHSLRSVLVQSTWLACFAHALNISVHNWPPNISSGLSLCSWNALVCIVEYIQHHLPSFGWHNNPCPPNQFIRDLRWPTMHCPLHDLSNHWIIAWQSCNHLMRQRQAAVSLKQQLSDIPGTDSDCSGNGRHFCVQQVKGQNLVEKESWHIQSSPWQVSLIFWQKSSIKIQQ